MRRPRLLAREYQTCDQRRLLFASEGSALGIFTVPSALLLAVLLIVPRDWWPVQSHCPHLFLPPFFANILANMPTRRDGNGGSTWSVWRLNRLPRHAAKRLVMMGSSVRFRASAPKNASKSRLSRAAFPLPPVTPSAGLAMMASAAGKRGGGPPAASPRLPNRARPPRTYVPAQQNPFPCRSSAGTQTCAGRPAAGRISRARPDPESAPRNARGTRANR